MKILLATGGTGGHLIPAMKVALALRALGDEVIFCGSFRIGRDLLEEHHFKVIDLGAQAFGRNGAFVFIKSALQMLRAFYRSFKILHQLNPDVVCGFGGYGSFPVVLMASLMRKKTIIHEQNVIPGRANNFLGRVVGKIACTFESSCQHFSSQKSVLTGCPSMVGDCGLSKESAREKLQLDQNKFTIMLMGGSQGSKFLNDVFSQSLQKMSQDEIQIIHVCGKKYYDVLKPVYDKLSMKVVLLDFYQEMELLYIASDLFVGRSGALTLTEIALQKLPAILVPYPFAQADHQMKNALLLKDQDGATIIDQKDLTAERLYVEIAQWRKRLNNFKYDLGCLKIFTQKQATSQIVKLIRTA